MVGRHIRSQSSHHNCHLLFCSCKIFNNAVLRICSFNGHIDEDLGAQYTYSNISKHKMVNRTTLVVAPRFPHPLFSRSHNEYVATTLSRAQALVHTPHAHPFTPLTQSTQPTLTSPNHPITWQPTLKKLCKTKTRARHVAFHMIGTRAPRTSKMLTAQ